MMKLSGLKAHIWQRISAVYLLLFFPYLFWQIQNTPIITRIELSIWLQSLFTPLFSALSFIAVALIMTHAWVGLRDIIIDYLPKERVNFWLRLYGLFLIIVCIDLIAIVIWTYPTTA